VTITDLHALIWQWVLAVAGQWVWILTSTILAAALTIVSAVRHEPIPRRAISWMIASALVVASFLAWRAERIALLTTRVALEKTGATLQAEREARGNIEQVHPWLRYAYGLENYEGSSEQAGNRDRVITRSSPPIRLHYARYSEANPVGFVFGIRNDNEKAPIWGVALTAFFIGDGVRVISHGTWISNLDNYEYVCGFQLISGQREMNCDSLRVLFPHPGEYTIRLVINALGLGEVRYDLPVVLID